jgi:hypothetical protein
MNYRYSLLLQSSICKYLQDGVAEGEEIDDPLARVSALFDQFEPETTAKEMISFENVVDYHHFYEAYISGPECEPKKVMRQTIAELNEKQRPFQPARHQKPQYLAFLRTTSGILDQGPASM